jgi:D-glycero-D-manno-heptose 1,7-bisphosphate phosphatase
MNKNKTLLLDRDGVINRDRGYIATLDRFEFVTGIFPFLRGALDRGYRLAILTNQSGVARGMFSVDDYNRLTAFMMAELYKQQIPIEFCLATFEHPEGTVAPFQRESFWRKPNPGMALEALRRLRSDGASSAFVGDALRDMEAARGARITQCFWLNDTPLPPPEGVVKVKNFDDILNALSF